MSKTRQGDEHLLVRSYAVTHPPNLHLSARSFPDWDQLAYASQGVMTVETAGGAWVVPPHRAVWIPAGVRFGVHMSGRVTVRTLFFRPRMRGRMPATCTAVEVTPLVHELVLHAARQNTLRRDDPGARRLARLLLDQLATLPVEPLRLPIPADPRARRAAESLRADPGGRRAMTRVARAAGASRRTLERLFVDETGMTLGRWRRRARLVEALRLLAAGEPVTRVALDVGYATPSAFVSAFRRELGRTPGRYFGREA
ncbi:MAG: helix-turn-helix transcriptional regulator [Vicinamibacteria bacterium]